MLLAIAQQQEQMASLPRPLPEKTSIGRVLLAIAQQEESMASLPWPLLEKTSIGLSCQMVRAARQNHELSQIGIGPHQKM